LSTGFFNHRIICPRRWYSMVVSTDSRVCTGHNHHVSKR
jgi:hypothetical protein